MNKTSLAFVLVLASSCIFLVTQCFIESLPDKTAKMKKNTPDKLCLELLTASNITNLERCEFFKCFEDRFACGKQYWIMNWGYKYCRRYANPDFIARFTDLGKQLLEHVNKCLPKHLERFYKVKKPMKCNKLSQDAFEAQGKCYQDQQSLFCKAFPENKDLFIEVLDHRDFINMNSVSMIRKTAEKCVPKIDLISLIG